MRYLVITKVPPDGDPGNLALELDVFVETDGDVKRLTDILAPHQALALRAPVFSVGEVLVCADGERESGYPGRKPSKWHVDYESFDTAEDAVARAQEVMYP